MNDKTRNKLNHILEAVPMSREHKNMLVEVFDEVSAGTGGGSNETYDIILNTKTNKVSFQNIEYNCNIELINEGDKIYFNVANNELRKVLADYIKSNNVIDMCIFEDRITIKSKVIMQMLEPTKEEVYIVTFTEYITSIKFID